MAGQCSSSCAGKYPNGWSGVALVTSGYVVGESGHPPAVAPLVYREPNFALPFAQFKGPLPTRERQMIVPAPRAAPELPFGSHDQSPAQALLECLVATD
jgi:hypothetical protein